MASPFLPLIGASFVDARGVLTREAREFLRLLSVNQTTITEVIVQVPDLADEIEALQLALGQKQNKDGDLTKIAGLNGTGGLFRTGNEAWSLRTFADTDTIGWTNPGGVAGNPSADFIGDASDVPIVDVGGYYTGTEVEAALQEVGAALAAVSSGVLPVVTGEISGDQPVFVYFDDGSLLYSEVA